MNHRLKNHLKRKILEPLEIMTKTKEKELNVLSERKNVKMRLEMQQIVEANQNYS